MSRELDVYLQDILESLNLKDDLPKITKDISDVINQLLSNNKTPDSSETA